MRADNCFGDVKSESPALAVGRTCLVRLVEAVEQQRKLLRRYGLTGIADAKARLLPVLLEHQSEAAAHGAELDGVIQQVIDHLRDGVAVRLRPDRFFRQIDADLQRAGVDLLLKGD